MKLMAQSILKTDKVDDLFVDPATDFKCMIDLDNTNMQQKACERQLFRNRNEVHELKVTSNKLKLVLKLRLVRGPPFIILMMEIIKQIKRMFLLELESGKEVLIPERLVMEGGTLP